jgi:hypothetical protein
MGRLLSIILFLVVIIAGVGFFRGWFSVSTQRAPFSEQRDINLRVNPEKFKQDANEVEGRTKDLFRSGPTDENPAK